MELSAQFINKRKRPLKTQMLIKLKENKTTIVRTLVTVKKPTVK